MTMINLLGIRKKLNHQRGTIIDVREIFEYHAGHIADAINITLDTLPDKLKVINALPKPITLYCRSGNRSALVAKYLRSAGVTEVRDGGSMQEMKAIRCTT